MKKLLVLTLCVLMLIPAMTIASSAATEQTGIYPMHRVYTEYVSSGEEPGINISYSKGGKILWWWSSQATAETYVQNPFDYYMSDLSAYAYAYVYNGNSGNFDSASTTYIHAQLRETLIDAGINDYYVTYLEYRASLSCPGTPADIQTFTLG